MISQVSPHEKAHLEKYKHIDWLYQPSPAATAYRIAPGLVFWLALALAVVCGAAAVVLASRWAAPAPRNVGPPGGAPRLLS